MTGLSPDIIRAWEKRYGVVKPVRGPRGARLYTRTDIDHLSLLGQLVGQGRAIGDIADLDSDALQLLLNGRSSSSAGEASEQAPSEAVARILESIQRFDLRALEVGLGEALLAHGSTRFVQDVAQPLLVEVGERWATGKMTVADEHLVSAALRRLVSGMLRLRAANSSSSLLLATPPGEQHELGLLLVALMAVDNGVKVYFLGSDLPVTDIVGAAERAQVAAVGLSVVNPSNREHAAAQLREIERSLHPEVELWIGGADAVHLAPHLEPTRALIVSDPAQVQLHLDRLRTRPGRFAS